MRRLAALALRFASTVWWVRALPAFACALAIWMLSARPGKIGSTPVWQSCLHNAAHVVAFGALSGLVWLALRAPRAGAKAWGAVALAACYGVVDELHQMYVPRRMASAGDVVSDLAGALLCVGLARWWLHGDRGGRRLALWATALACGSVAFESLA